MLRPYQSPADLEIHGKRAGGQKSECKGPQGRGGWAHTGFREAREPSTKSERRAAKAGGVREGGLYLTARGNPWDCKETYGVMSHTSRSLTHLFSAGPPPTCTDFFVFLYFGFMS